MKLELVVYPNDALQTKITEEWNFENPQYNAEELRTEMLRIMVENKGIGLSANQVGINVRAFVFVNSFLVTYFKCMAGSGESPAELLAA